MMLIITCFHVNKKSLNKVKVDIKQWGTTLLPKVQEFPTSVHVGCPQEITTNCLNIFSITCKESFLIYMKMYFIL